MARYLEPPHGDRYRLTPDTENVLRITKEIV